MAAPAVYGAFKLATWAAGIVLAGGTGIKFAGDGASDMTKLVYAVGFVGAGYVVAKKTGVV